MVPCGHFFNSARRHPNQIERLRRHLDFAELFRRAATFVDKIIKGAKPADLPFERASKFETIVNLKTAKAIGVELPTSVLLRADQVIE